MEHPYVLLIFGKVILGLLLLNNDSRPSPFIHFEAQTEFRNYLAGVGNISLPVRIFRDRWEIVDLQEPRFKVKMSMLLLEMA